MPTVITSTAPAIVGTKAAFLNSNVAALAPASAAAAVAAATAADVAEADHFVTDLQDQLKVLVVTNAAATATAAATAVPAVTVSEYILNQQMVTVRLSGGGRVTFRDAFDQLFSKMYKPTSVKDFVERLSEVNRLAIAAGIAEPGSVAVPPAALADKSANSVYNELKKMGHLETFLNGFRPVSFIPALPALDINRNRNLSLLLANPLIAKIVMDERKKQNLAALARPTAAMGWGPFGGVPPAISMSFRGGANAALASVDPSNYDPIEMRGAGPMLAAMRGGMVVGTTSSPTQWRPIDDNSFISASLEGAIAQLKANIAQHQGATLDAGVETQVTNLIQALKTAEKNVKEERDRLTTMNNAIATGYKPNGNVGTADIQAATESYNAAMKNRQKIENKLFRVVIALGGKQIYP